MCNRLQNIVRMLLIGLSFFSIFVRGEFVAKDILFSVSDNQEEKHHPVCSCFIPSEQNFMILTNSSKSASRLDPQGLWRLWNFDKNGQLIWQILLRDQEGKPLKLPITSGKLILSERNSLYLLTQRRHDSQETSISCPAALPIALTKQYGSLQICFLPTFYVSSFLGKSFPLLNKDDQFYTVAKNRNKGLKNVLIVLDRQGNITMSR